MTSEKAQWTHRHSGEACYGAFGFKPAGQSGLRSRTIPSVSFECYTLKQTNTSIRNGYRLADIFVPSDKQSFYYLPYTNDNDKPAGQYYIFSQNSPLPESGSATPLPTEFEKAHIFTGVWSPGARTPSIDDWDSSPAESESAPDPGSPMASSSNAASLPSAYWILHPKLLGIAIRVDINGGAYNTVEK